MKRIFSSSPHTTSTPAPILVTPGSKNTQKSESPIPSLRAAETSSFKFELGSMRIELQGVSVLAVLFLATQLTICATAAIIYFLALLFSTSFLVQISLLFIIWMGLRYADSFFRTFKKGEVEIKEIENDYLKTETVIGGEVRKREIESKENVFKLDRAIQMRCEQASFSHSGYVTGPD